MKTFRELRVWQAAMILVEKVYKLTRDFPKQETYGLTSQIRRAAVSIPSNIAEGHTREHLKEYLQHLSMAQASLAELETHNWRLLSVCDTCRRKQSNRSNPTSICCKQMYALRNALKGQS